jgi:hypothetical protein
MALRSFWFFRAFVFMRAWTGIPVIARLKCGVLDLRPPDHPRPVRGELRVNKRGPCCSSPTYLSIDSADHRRPWRPGRTPRAAGAVHAECDGGASVAGERDGSPDARRYAGDRDDPTVEASPGRYPRCGKRADHGQSRTQGASRRRCRRCSCVTEITYRRQCLRCPEAGRSAGTLAAGSEICAHSSFVGKPMTLDATTRYKTQSAGR